MVTGLVGTAEPVMAPPLAVHVAVSPPGYQDSSEKVPWVGWMGSGTHWFSARVVPVPGQPPEGSSTDMDAPRQLPVGVPHAQAVHERPSSKP